MRVVMIGGTGFIGRYVAAILGREHEVMVLHRGKHAGPAEGTVRHVTGDRNRLGEHTALFRSYKPEVVVDMISGDEHHARGVVEAFRGVAGRLVTISSMDVYRAYEIALGLTAEAIEPTPLYEDSPVRTVRYPYRGRPVPSMFDWVTPEYDKILVEQAVRSQPDLPATILRLPMVYGPGDPLHRFLAFVKRIEDGRPVIAIEQGWAGWRGPMGYVEDVAAGIARAATSEAATGRTYNIAEADALSWAEWAQAVAEACGWQGRIVTLPREHAPAHLAPPFNTAQDWTADSSRIRGELGYREGITRGKALERTAAWERAQAEIREDAALQYAAEDRAVATA